MNTLYRRHSLFALVCLLGSSSIASAGTSAEDEERAALLFEQAKAKMAQGKYDEACATFERSVELKRGAGTMFNLAECLTKQGKVASARALFVEVAETTRELGQPERTRVAEQRASELLPRLFRLSIELEEPVDGLRVTLDGDELSEKQLSSAQPVDPGTHVVEASAPGKRSWKMSLGIPTGAGNSELVIPALEELPAPGPVAKASPQEPIAAGERSASIPDAGPVEQDAGGPSTGRRVLTYGMAGLGVLGIAGGVAMGLEFKANNDDAKAICPSSNDCSNSEILRHNEFVGAAEDARTWALISGGAGTALLAGAIILWATEDDSNQASVRPQPFVTADGSYGGGLFGRF